MKEHTQNIPYKNQLNPHSKFDLITLEDLFLRENLDHSPEALHRVDFYLLLFVVDGNGKHTIDFTDFECSKGTLISVRKDQIHKFQKSKNIKGFLLLFTDEFLVSYLEEMEAQKTMLLFNELLGAPKLQLRDDDYTTIVQIIDRINEEYHKKHDKHTLSIIRSELHILITKLFRIKAKFEKIDFERRYLPEFVELQQLIEEQASTTTKVLDYSRMMGVSTKTLNTITKSIVHKTAKQFIDEICTKQIKRMLINTELSIKEIAIESGFEETTNFYKYFKRQTQTTPEQFRDSL